MDEKLDREPLTANLPRTVDAAGTEEDRRLPYVAPTLATVESKLSALLGSVCQPDPDTGVPDT